LANQASGFTTYLALQNISNGAASVQIQYYDLDGNNIASDTCTNLAANAECLPLNKFTAGSQGAGVINSDQPLNVIVAEGTPYGGSAYAVNEGSTTNLVAPLAINNASGGFNTRISVFNGGSLPASVTVQFYNLDGSHVALADRQLLIQTHTSSTLDQTQSGSGLPTGYYGWALITGDSGNRLVAQVLEQNPNSNFVAIANAQLLPNAGTNNTLYAPAIFRDAYGGFMTGENIVNPNTNPVTVTLTYYDTSGNTPANSTAIHILAPDAVLPLYDGNGNTGLPASFAGSAAISSNGGGVVMVVNEIGPSVAGSSASGTYAAASTGSNQVYLPVVANGGFGYITGLTILNTSNQPVSGVISYYNLDGSAQGASQNFQIGAFASQPAYQGAPQAGLPKTFYGTAIVRVTSGPNNALIVTTNALSAFTFYTYTEPTQ
jgi:hypothetical protein